MKKLKLLQKISNTGVVAVLRGDSPEEVIAMFRANHCRRN